MIKDNIIYCTIERGDFLDMIDFVPSKEDIKNGTTDPRRKFTVLALSNETEFLSLSIENLEEIKKDFIDVYDELFMHAISHLRKLTDL